MTRASVIPFIGSVLWSDGQHRQINFVIKRIIRLFIDYVSIDFPKEKIQILSVSQRIIHSSTFRIFTLFIYRNHSVWSTWCTQRWIYATTKWRMVWLFIQMLLVIHTIMATIFVARSTHNWEVCMPYRNYAIRFYIRLSFIPNRKPSIRYEIVHKTYR